MRSKEEEDAIDKTNQLQQAIKEKGKKFVFYDNENAVIGYECLKTALSYIETLEQLPNKIRHKIQEISKLNFNGRFIEYDKEDGNEVKNYILKEFKEIVGE